MKELEKLVENLGQVLENIDINKELDNEEIRELERLANEIDMDKVLKDTIIT